MPVSVMAKGKTVFSQASSVIWLSQEGMHADVLGYTCP